jgi:nitroreductase
MEVFEAIYKRHSYRGEFKKSPVPREDLKKIVDAGIHAPSGTNAQTTDFIIADDAELIQQIYRIVGSPVLSSARAVIVCIAEAKAVYKGMSFEVEDCSAAVENMLLAVTALGYATVWLDGVLRREEKARRIAELFAIPPGKTIRVILPLGVPVEEKKQKEKKTFDERAWFNRYGGA